MSFFSINVIFDVLSIKRYILFILAPYNSNSKLYTPSLNFLFSNSVYGGKLKASDESQKIDFFASSSKDSTIRLWKLAKSSAGIQRECVAEGRGHTQDIGALAFANCGLDFLVSGSMDTTVKLWRLAESEGKLALAVRWTSKAHDKDVNSVCVSANDKLVASGSSDKTAKVWRATDGSCLAVLRGHKRGVWCVSFSTVDQVRLRLGGNVTFHINLYNMISLLVT